MTYEEAAKIFEKAAARGWTTSYARRLQLLEIMVHGKS